MSPKSTRRTRRLFSYRNLLFVLLLAGAVAVCLKATRTYAAATLTVDNTTDNGALTACTAAPNDCSSATSE